MSLLQLEGCLEKWIMSFRKIYGGTPVGNESRCDTCSHARIIQGYAESERIVFCDAAYPPVNVPFRVRQCSMYEDRRFPGFFDLGKNSLQIPRKSAGDKGRVLTVSPQTHSPKTKKPQE